MKRNELKKMLKPLIKECIKECIFEEGVLSGIIKEVAQGMSSQQVVVESAARPTKKDSIGLRRKEEEYEKQRQERIRRLNETVKIADLDLNIFEGTQEIIPESKSPSGALSGVSPNDPGVDIDGIMNLAGKKWKHLM